MREKLRVIKLKHGGNEDNDVVVNNAPKSFSCARHDVATQHAFTLNEHN